MPARDLPSEDTTEVETDILLNNGQGMVIGGLIQESDTNTQSKIPWFGDLPYVGVLFQKRQVVKERSEIIVTLMPHVLPYSPMIAEREQGEFMRAERSADLRRRSIAIRGPTSRGCTIRSPIPAARLQTLVAHRTMPAWSRRAGSSARRYDLVAAG